MSSQKIRNSEVNNNRVTSTKISSQDPVLAKFKGTLRQAKENHFGDQFAPQISTNYRKCSSSKSHGGRAHRCDTHVFKNEEAAKLGEQNLLLMRACLFKSARFIEDVTKWSILISKFTKNSARGHFKRGSKMRLDHENQRRISATIGTLEYRTCESNSRGKMPTEPPNDSAKSKNAAGRPSDAYSIKFSSEILMSNTSKANKANSHEDDQGRRRGQCRGSEGRREYTTIHQDHIRPKESEETEICLSATAMEGTRRRKRHEVTGGRMSSPAHIYLTNTVTFYQLFSSYYPLYLRVLLSPPSEISRPKFPQKSE